MEKKKKNWIVPWFTSLFIHCVYIITWRGEKSKEFDKNEGGGTRARVDKGGGVLMQG